MMKLTVLYGHPTDSRAFEEYYASTHMPITRAMKGLARLETTQFVPGLDGSEPAFYRMAEMWFADATQMQTTFDSPEGKATVDDLPNFATGGVTVLVGVIDA